MLGGAAHPPAAPQLGSHTEMNDVMSTTASRAGRGHDAHLHTALKSSGMSPFSSVELPQLHTEMALWVPP